MPPKLKIDVNEDKNTDPEERLVELRLKEADLHLKMKEIALKDIDILTRRGWRKYLSLPLIPIFFTALTGFIVSQYTSYLQFGQNDALERKKLQSSLFLKAIETGDTNISAKNLLFILHLGLIDDPGGKIAALENAPQDAPVLASPSPIVPQTTSSLQKFFSAYKASFGVGWLDNSIVSNLTKIFSSMSKDESIKDVRYAAYILATIFYETNGKFDTSIELCHKFCREHYGERYRGRGYLQLTGFNSYNLAGHALGIDLIGNPELAADPGVAYRTTSWLMMGHATGLALSKFITDEGADYVNARRVVNGLDKAELIATYAKQYESILRESLK